MNYTAIYPEKRTFEKFDQQHFILYLNESEVTYNAESHATEGDDVNQEPINGFSYTGTLEDGGTKIVANVSTYDAFVAGLIRLRYSSNDSEALQANMMASLINSEHIKAVQYSQEWEQFQAYREESKNYARLILCK